MELEPISEEEMQQIYNWVDEIPLSRPKKNISRDFSDGILMAEVVKHFIPRIVDLHNYSAANSVGPKMANWNTINAKIFKKLGFQVSKSDINKIINSSAEIIERLLLLVKTKIQQYLSRPKMSPQQITQDNNQDESEDTKNEEKGIGNLTKMNKEGVFGGNPLIQKNKSLTQELIEKDNIIKELKETIEILEEKIKKLEQLIKLKDSKIQTMANKLAEGNQN